MLFYKQTKKHKINKFTMGNQPKSGNKQSSTKKDIETVTRQACDSNGITYDDFRQFAKNLVYKDVMRDSVIADWRGSQAENDSGYIGRRDQGLNQFYHLIEPLKQQPISQNSYIKESPKRAIELAENEVKKASQDHRPTSQASLIPPQETNNYKLCYLQTVEFLKDFQNYKYQKDLTSEIAHLCQKSCQDLAARTQQHRHISSQICMNEDPSPSSLYEQIMSLFLLMMKRIEKRVMVQLGNVQAKHKEVAEQELNVIRTQLVQMQQMSEKMASELDLQHSIVKDLKKKYDKTKADLFQRNHQIKQLTSIIIKLTKSQNNPKLTKNESNPDSMARFSRKLSEDSAIKAQEKGICLSINVHSEVGEFQLRIDEATRSDGEKRN